MSQFVYGPLGPKEIRLITFEKDSDPPAFSLRHCQLRRASRNYICLSYCWGVAVSPHLVLCNGKRLQVQANLYDALIQLARREHTQYYWIDAICINQSDLHEKGFQIQLMGQIFERAGTVYIWLGTTSERENEDMMSLPNLESPLRFFLEKREKKIEIQDWSDHGLPPLDSLFWETLGNILNRSWFKRLWVVQEIALSRSSFVLLGDRTLTFLWVACATRILTELFFRGQMPSKCKASQAAIEKIFEVMVMCEEIVSFQMKTASLENRQTISLSSRTNLLLNMLRKQEVSHAADRVHGMMGMFKHKFVKKVSTNANSTVAETYESFAVASLLADERLTLLHHVSPTPAVTGLPSWCPDLTRLPAPTNLGDVIHSRSLAEFRSGIPISTFRRIRRWHETLSRLIPPRMAFQSPQATALFLPTSKTLLVKGIIIDKVAHIVYDHPCWDFSTTSLSQIEHWEQECLKISQTTLRCPDTIPAPHARTLIANKKLLGDLAQGPAERRDPSAAYVRARESLKAKSLEQMPHPGYIYMNNMAISCSHRRFISTTGNRIGLCPPHSKQGDLICILWGARSPFVLRPVESTGNFQLIGECYVDGLMYGEAFQIKSKERLKNMAFPLI